MGRQFEIERKFLVKQLPPAGKRTAGCRIEQGYFPIHSKDLEIRLRSKDSRHFITFKKGRGLSRQEEEIEIPRSRFLALWPLTRGARVTKCRHKLSWDKRIIELDVYQGRHRGLVTAEVEFESARQSRSFRTPDWFAREITGSRSYANRTLARSRGIRRNERAS
jgi:CYTH domain-containing protein